MSASSAETLERPLWQIRESQSEPRSAIRSAPTTSADRDELVSSQIVGRVNAASSSDEEVNGLLAERKALIEKKYEVGLSVIEDYKLQFVRWNIDRIDSARHGASLDALERKFRVLKNLSSDIVSLQRDLEAYRASQDERTTANSTRRSTR